MEKTLATVEEILNELKQTKQTDEFGIFEELRQKTNELAIEANECFIQRIEEDFVSLWISHINFGMRSQRILGGFEYNTENLKFGPLGIRLCVKQLSDEELD